MIVDDASTEVQCTSNENDWEYIRRCIPMVTAAAAAAASSGWLFESFEFCDRLEIFPCSSILS